MIYNKTADQIKSIQDLIEFIEFIPEENWCTETRNDYNGRCCILGHLDAITGDPYSGSRSITSRLGLSESELAKTNNGRMHHSNEGPFIEGAKFDGWSIKSRLLKYLALRKAARSEA